MIKELDYLEFDDQKLEDFFNKFTYNNLEQFNMILYFSSFSSSIKELVERLKQVKDKVSKTKQDDQSQTRIEESITLLNKKELELVIGLLDEADFCTSSDNRYTEENIYLDYLRTKASMELVKNKRK